MFSVSLVDMIAVACSPQARRVLSIPLTDPWQTENIPNPRVMLGTLLGTTGSAPNVSRQVGDPSFPWKQSNSLESQLPVRAFLLLHLCYMDICDTAALVICPGDFTFVYTLFLSQSVQLCSMC